MSDGVTVIGLLGPVAVGDERGGPDGLVSVPGVRARRLLVSLALAGGRARSADRLIDDVWGDRPPRSPASALHTQISRLRPLLGHTRIEGVGNGYRLVGCRTDLDIVAGLVDSSDTDDLGRATRWWRGAPGDDLGDDGDDLHAELRRRAGHLQEQIDQCQVAAALAAGEYRVAREIADKRCRADPLDESAHVDMMRALAGEGRVADALAAFARLRRTLSEQLGVDPGAPAVALHAQLVATELVATENGPAAVDTSPDASGRSSKTTRARTVGLRVDASDLIGRDDDIAAIVGLLDRHRLVTVQGPGGVGKTRVAHRVGDAMADTGRPVFYVPLAPIRNDDDVVAAIAAALGVGETDIGSGGRPRLAVGDLADRLVDAVRGQRAVLILDNCEQVVERCARVATDLLTVEPQLSIVTTSRSPLMLAAEQIYQLPVLDVGLDGAAVELFERRALAVRPDARLPREEVAGLCVHLDGIPLAIELAAARIRTMTVAQISARLVERFALLRGSDRTAPDRHRTLFAVIEWSWDLLEPDARQAMRRLCRFPAGVTTDAAAIVVGHDGVRLDDSLAALVNQSLLSVIEADGHIRYRMLEMVREFGEEMLTRSSDPAESDDLDSAMWRWAREFAARAEFRFGVAVDEGLFAGIAADAENLVWVLRRCVEAISGADTARSLDAVRTVVSVFPVLGGFWMGRGLHGEVMAWGARLIPVLPRPPRDPDDETRRRWQATLLASMAHLAMRHDLRLVARARYHTRLLHRPDRVFDEPTELLSACAVSRNPRSAMRFVSRSTRAANDQVRSAGLTIRMNFRENLGNLDRALADGLALHALARGENNEWMGAMTNIAIGAIYGQRAQWGAALEYYREAVGNLARLGARDDEFQTRSYLAAVLVALGRLDEAATELEIVGGGWEPSDPDPQGNPEVIGGMMISLAELEYAHGDVARSAEIYRRAAHLIERDHPLGAQDPGVALLVSTAMVGLTRAGELDRASEFLTMLADGVNPTVGPVIWFDQAQAGSMAMAVGYLLCEREPGSRDGRRLLAIAGRVGARQDFPALYATRSRLPDIAGLTAVEWESLVEEVRMLTRRQAVDEIRTILAPQSRAGRR
ncbi:BTAD domain-containing putative transcriptional regulator [Gordonia rhizosphera]|uniref:Putative AfsR family transcriptional regulator n=1 Tax=Gordonia rhizosphera NBRC 16068 TaxID=1108045 RepID=K6X519_9ACTN|nr:BTAD domain-containing putative transcriptional regulator [Gordonia rhizosphera]GAB93874.1 putative AfsR family transcriptional regulator [Gordonia rhizosphera NBRC 16068]